MTLPAPPVVRQAWGDELVAEVIPWVERIVDNRATPLFEQIVAEKAVPRDEYREVLSRLDVLEHGVSDLKVDVRELRVDVRELRTEMNERFDRVNERFVEMERHIETRLDRMYRHSETRFDQMTERMMVQNRWLIGSLALFATIISILVAIGQFTP